MSLIAELKRRNVFKVGAAYLALAWMEMQLTSIVVPAFELPDWTLKFVIWFGVIGFPCTLVFAWIYELTPERLKRDCEVDPGTSITHSIEGPRRTVSCYICRVIRGVPSMKHRLLMPVAFCLAAGCVPQEAAADPANDLKRVADGYFEAVIEAYPIVVYFGLTDVATPDHSALPDNSPAAFDRFAKVEDALLADLLKLDPKKLVDRRDWVTFQSLKESMESDVGLRVCQQYKWDLNHMGGWQSRFSAIADEQPVDTPEHRAAALARWSKLDAYIAQDRANLEAGLAEGYSAPKRVVARVVAQLDGLIAAPFEEHPFFSFAGKTEDTAFKVDIKAVFDDEVIPALVAYRAFLHDDYAPQARDSLAISGIPNGADCYEAMLRSYHSAEIGSKRTFDRGEETVAANKQAVIARGEAMFGEPDFVKVLARVKEVPDNRFTNEEEVVAFTRVLALQARAKVQPFFTKLPSQDLLVEPYAEYLKGTGQSSRYVAKPPAEGAATYRINTDDWRNQTRGKAEIVLVHEGWPGHHLQSATAYALDGLHPANRLASSTAYIEGWARYSEALAEEAGIYKGGYGEISRRAWPGRGMVVDPGIHLYGWTNERAKAFLMEAGESEQAVEVMLDRIAVIPGQLTAYDTGGLEIFALRNAAEERLGEAFDIREFHDRVLENGALPLGALREHIEAWIAEKGKAR